MTKRYRGPDFNKPVTKQIVFEEETVKVAMKLADKYGVNFSEIVRRSLDEYFIGR